MKDGIWANESLKRLRNTSLQFTLTEMEIIQNFITTATVFGTIKDEDVK